MADLRDAARALLEVLRPHGGDDDELDRATEALRAALKEADAPQDGGESVACADCAAGHPRYFVPSNGETIHALPGGMVNFCAAPSRSLVASPPAHDAAQEPPRAAPRPTPAETEVTLCVCGHPADWHGHGGSDGTGCDGWERCSCIGFRQEPPRAKPSEGGEGAK